MNLPRGSISLRYEPASKTQSAPRCSRNKGALHAAPRQRL